MTLVVFSLNSRQIEVDATAAGIPTILVEAVRCHDFALPVFSTRSIDGSGYTYLGTDYFLHDGQRCSAFSFCSMAAFGSGGNK